MRGGRREGAGRPPINEAGAMWRVTVRLPSEYVLWLKAEGDGNMSRGLRRLLEELDQLRGQAEAGQGPKGRR